MGELHLRERETDRYLEEPLFEQLMPERVIIRLLAEAIRVQLAKLRKRVHKVVRPATAHESPHNGAPLRLHIWRLHRAVFPIVTPAEAPQDAREECGVFAYNWLRATELFPLLLLCDGASIRFPMEEMTSKKLLWVEIRSAVNVVFMIPGTGELHPPQIAKGEAAALHAPDGTGAVLAIDASSGQVLALAAGCVPIGPFRVNIPIP
jgi:hypothetical protein